VPANPQRCVQVLAFDLSRLVGYLNGIAYAQAALNHTRVQWRPDQDFANSRVLSSVYSLLGYTPPGTAEVAQDVGRIEEDRKRLLAKYWTVSLHKLSHGPLTLLHYLNAMDEVKQGATDGLKDIFRDVGSLNSDIADATHDAVVRLADIRLASSLFVLSTTAVVGIGLTAVGAAGTAFQLAAVSTGYQVIGNFARSIQEAHSAKAIVFKTGGPVRDRVLEQGGDKLAGNVEKAAEKRLEQASETIEAAERQVAQLAQQLKRKIGNSAKSAKLARKLGRQTEALGAGMQTAKNAGRVMKTAKFTGGVVLPLVFLAHDLYEAVEEYRSDVGAGE
jgi:hypothetical protein